VSLPNKKNKFFVCFLIFFAAGLFFGTGIAIGVFSQVHGESRGTKKQLLFLYFFLGCGRLEGFVLVGNVGSLFWKRLLTSNCCFSRMGGGVLGLVGVGVGWVGVGGVGGVGLVAPCWGKSFVFFSRCGRLPLVCFTPPHSCLWTGGLVGGGGVWFFPNFFFCGWFFPAPPRQSPLKKKTKTHYSFRGEPTKQQTKPNPFFFFIFFGGARLSPLFSWENWVLTNFSPNDVMIFSGDREKFLNGWGGFPQGFPPPPPPNKTVVVVNFKPPLQGNPKNHQNPCFSLNPRGVVLSFHCVFLLPRPSPKVHTKPKNPTKKNRVGKTGTHKSAPPPNLERVAVNKPPPIVLSFFFCFFFLL